MLKSHVKFHAANEKRLVLVADDEYINRQLLGALLQDEYEVLFAENGQETIDKVREVQEDLSLVLLDLMMPVKSGLDVLREMRADPVLSHIPVIVLTSDQDAEIECLEIGAIDYIPKPYPPSGIILARIVRAIELTEDREIIQLTERDPLTGLYNREYFYNYAVQYDQHHRDCPMDAIVLDINHFHMINERFGNAFGDNILKDVGERIRGSVAESGGIVCRREADTFMVYCPTGLDYTEILRNASVVLSDSEAVNSRIRLRMGVYSNVDKALDIERRFDRAKVASMTVRSSATQSIGFYDNSLHERELYEEQLVEGFHTAIQEQQFRVYYQPKLDISEKHPVLVSAEALVRWDHPTLGLISPSVFIPLFEDNGLIQELDRYVWDMTARDIRDWKDRLGFSVPVSVNVSRIDMYDPNLPETFRSILKRHRLDAGDLFLEITESAYMEDSRQITDMANQLRSLGFLIEMDDFGTGYSSLSLISSLPIDALKLDMLFVRNAFNQEKDTHILEVVIKIADHLSVPVVAEGVETEEQVLMLRELGCAIAQGYYFSKPIASSEFETWLIKRKAEISGTPAEIPVPVSTEPAAEPAPASPEPEKTKESGVKLLSINRIFVILVFLIISTLIVSDVLVNRGNNKLAEANRQYINAEQAVFGLERGSDTLTENVMAFVVTGNRVYLDNFFTEVHSTMQRENALATLNQLIGNEESSSYQNLKTALDLSNELMLREYKAMRLAADGYGLRGSDLPEEILAVELNEQEAGLLDDQKKATAIQLIFDTTYAEYKDQIKTYVRASASDLIETSDQSIRVLQKRMRFMLFLQNALLVLLAIAMLGEVLFIMLEIRIPLAKLVDQMRSGETVVPAGARELRFVTQTYNEILTEARDSHRQLTYEATHDPLTGLMNRNAYEMFMDNVDAEHIALIIVDIDGFKSFNDSFGHDVGDVILKRVATVLTERFRSVDAICRFGGDEFVVVMTWANSTMQQLFIDKMSVANRLLGETDGSSPAVSISAGIAFSDRKDPTGNIFKDADTALYRVKNAGRSGCAVYGDPEIVRFTDET